MTKDQEATQEGVSDSAQDRRSAIYKAADDAKVEELKPVEALESDIVYEDKPPEDGEPEPKEAAPVAEVPKEEPVEETQPTEPTYKIKVDGVEQEWPLSKILAQAQKHTAADKRLEEATLLLRQAEERARTAPPPVAPRERPEPKPAPLDELPIDQLKGRISEVDRRLWTEATTEEEIRSLQQEKLALEEAFFDRKLTERERMAEDRAKAKAEEEAQKVFLIEVQKAHPDLDDITLLKDATGKAVGLKPDFETWLSEQPLHVQWGYMSSPDPRDPIAVLNRFKEARAPVSRGIQETRDRKRGIDVVPAGSARLTPEPEKPPPTNAEYVAQLKQRRSALGQDYS